MIKKSGKVISININLTNKWLYTLIAIFVTIFVSVNVLAWTNPITGVGHDYTDLEPCPNGQILKASGGVWTCGTDVDTNTNANTECSGGYNYLNGNGVCRDVRADGDIYDHDTLNCYNVQASSGSQAWVLATCNSGYVVTGGGFSGTFSAQSSPWPTGETTWFCAWPNVNSNYKCYARCCRIIQ